LYISTSLQTIYRLFSSSTISVVENTPLQKRFSPSLNEILRQAHEYFALGKKCFRVRQISFLR